MIYFWSLFRRRSDLSKFRPTPVFCGHAYIELEPERTAVAELGLHAESGGVRGKDRLAYGKSQPRADGCALCVRRAVISVPNGIELVVRNALAVIGNFDARPSALRYTA